MSDSKTNKIIEAARKRNQLEQENNKSKPAAGKTVESKEETEQRIEAAEEMASIKVQPRAGIVDGEIDVEAMGDVKGNGGDAKNYEEGDPDKALGVPVYEHGLHETPSPLNERHASKRTQEEINRGREAVEAREKSRADAQKSKSTVSTGKGNKDEKESGK